MVGKDTPNREPPQRKAAESRLESHRRSDCRFDAILNLSRMKAVRRRHPGRFRGRQNCTDSSLHTAHSPTERLLPGRLPSYRVPGLAPAATSRDSCREPPYPPEFPIVAEGPSVGDAPEGKRISWPPTEDGTSRKLHLMRHLVLSSMTAPCPENSDQMRQHRRHRPGVGRPLDDAGQKHCHSAGSSRETETYTLAEQRNSLITCI